MHQQYAVYTRKIKAILIDKLNTHTNTLYPKNKIPFKINLLYLHRILIQIIGTEALYQFYTDSMSSTKCWKN